MMGNIRCTKPLLYTLSSSSFREASPINPSMEERKPAILFCSSKHGGIRSSKLSKSFCPKVLFLPAPPGEAIHNSSLPFGVKKKYFIYVTSALFLYGLYIGNL